MSTPKKKASSRKKATTKKKAPATAAASKTEIDGVGAPSIYRSGKMIRISITVPPAMRDFLNEQPIGQAAHIRALIEADMKRAKLEPPARRI